jgi:hypothetical protein
LVRVEFNGDLCGYPGTPNGCNKTIFLNVIINFEDGKSEILK